MAALAKMTVRVQKNRTASRLRISTTGTYAALVTSGVSIDVPNQPLYSTADAKTFWLAVQAAVAAQLEALP